MQIFPGAARVDDPVGSLDGVGRLHRPDHATLTERVQEHVARAITSGSVQPGQLLIIDQLAAAMGVSKTPIREALRALIHDGLVREVNGAPHVAPLDVDYVREVYAVRSALESLAVQVVAPSLTASDIHELEATLAPVEGGDYAEHFGPDLEFHDLLRAKCRWPYLNQLIDTVRIHRTRVRALEADAHLLHLKAGYEEHRAILDALRERDANLARALMQQHLDRLGAVVAQLAAEEAAA